MLLAEKHMNMGNEIRRLIIKTSFPPLSYLYKALYDLSLAIAILLFKRIKGVSSIYLRRGMTYNEVTYGLSDIDLLIIINDESGRRDVIKHRVKNKVISTYETLSRVIPLFGHVDEELGIYTVTEFFELYENYPFYRYRFNNGKTAWKLLFGKDWARNLPEIEIEELKVLATEELKVWWSFLTSEFEFDSKRPLFRRKYLWYKAVSEACRIYLFLCHGETVRKRITALNEVKRFLNPEQNTLIDNIKGYRKDLTSKDGIAVDDLMQLFIELTQEAFKGIKKVMCGKEKGRIIGVPCQGCAGSMIRKDQFCELQQKMEMLLEKALGDSRDSCESVVLVPKIDFGMDILSNLDIDASYLVLVLKDLVPVERLRNFVSSFESWFGVLHIEPCIEYGGITFSLRTQLRGQSIKGRQQDPIFYGLLSCDPLRLPGRQKDRPGVDGEVLKLELPAGDFERAIGKRRRGIDEMLSNRGLSKLMPLNFFRFFWGAARTKVLAQSLEDGRISIPLNSRQIMETLGLRYPEYEGWLEALYKEYVKELLGEESNAYRFYSHAGDFLRRMSCGQRSHLTPLRNDELNKRLSISVVIITLDRAQSLKDTLDSLVLQKRRADEVIVVDNGSCDHTKEIVFSFEDKLPLKYIQEIEKGIPNARNAGVKNATKDIVAFIDDDCAADENWLKYMEMPFIRDASVGAVGGEVSYLETGDGIVEQFYIEQMQARAADKDRKRCEKGYKRGDRVGQRVRDVILGERIQDL